jgi:hypothetical protein
MSYARYKTNFVEHEYLAYEIASYTPGGLSNAKLHRESNPRGLACSFGATHKNLFCYGMMESIYRQNPRGKKAKRGNIWGNKRNAIPVFFNADNHLRALCGRRHADHLYQ